MKIIFMGTPDFAVPSLKALIENGYTISAVFTQPDRAKGRGQKIKYSPVKEVALQYGIPVYQPEKLKEDPWTQTISDLKPDMIVVVAYGQILKEELLNTPLLGCINVHASLLPKYRGAAPINWAVINGEEVTGITTMHMAKGLDSGDMIIKRETKIGPEETAGELHDRLAIIGAEVLIHSIKLLANNKAPRTPQEHSQSTYAPMLTKELGRINWKDTTNNIYNIIRGTTPWPTAYTFYRGKMLKVWSAQGTLAKSKDAPGTIVKKDEKGLHVSTGDGTIIVKEIQPEGSKRMTIESYLRGNDIAVGSAFDF